MLLAAVVAFTQLLTVIVLLIAGSKSTRLTAPVLGWVEDSVIRSDNPDVGVAEPFSRCADIWIVW